MNFKVLFFGAAGMLIGTSAIAENHTGSSELSGVPNTVDYVRICDAYGARFYSIPDTETCLRVGGRVRTQVVVNDGKVDDRDQDGYSWLARGYLYLDARTATEFGVLRSYIAMNGSSTNGGNGGFAIDDAYIRWGGLTAGRLGSNFDINTGQVFMGNVTRNWSDTTLNQFAFTSAFGNGLSGTVALENSASRDQGTLADSSAKTSGGTLIPDIVAALGIDQWWGSAQLSGALHQVYLDQPTIDMFDDAEDTLGWAIGGGVTLDLPMINSDSNIFFQGFFADGAMSYIGGSWSSSDSSVTLSDFSIDADGSTVTRTGYSVSSGIYIQASPEIGVALDGSYLSADSAGSKELTNRYVNDVSRWAIDASVVWAPVSGFEIGADVGYSSTEFGDDDTSTAEDDNGSTGDLVAGIRLQRTF